MSRYWNPVTTRVWYRLVSRYFSNDDSVFFDWGYEEDPPMGVPLSESDDPYRPFIQLYHRTATQVDLADKRVLEVSCGHGGGASYLVRTLGPASYTGLDLNPEGIAFCQRRHELPGMDFVHGNAQTLPFAADSFDAVLNIEASHCYPHFPQFLDEVARVLRPGGHFLYADARRQHDVAQWEEDLRNAPIRLISEREINEQVARAIEKTYPVILLKAPSRPLAVFNFAVFWGAYHSLQDKKISYRMYCFAAD